jgi:hypothetical protein
MKVCSGTGYEVCMWQSVQPTSTFPLQILFILGLIRQEYLCKLYSVKVLLCDWIVR